MSRKRKKWIQIRVDEKEKKQIEELAKAKRMPVGLLIRNTMLDFYDQHKPRKGKL